MAVKSGHSGCSFLLRIMFGYRRIAPKLAQPVTVMRSPADTPRKTVLDRNLVRGSSVANILAFFMSAAGAVRMPFTQARLIALPPSERWTLVLQLSVICAVMYGLSWTAIDSLCGWDIGGLGEGKRPLRGWAAVVLATCLSLPLALVPVAYQSLTGLHFLSSSHAMGSGVAILGGVVAHLGIFGFHRGRPSGFRRAVLRRVQSPLASELLVLLIWSGVVVCAMVVPYLMAIAGSVAAFDVWLVSRLVFSTLLTLFGTSIFILLKYPDSVKNPVWIQTRAIVASILINFSLVGGMYS